MKLRTRLDLFSAALLSALGATQLVGCGGSAVVPGTNPGGGDAGAGSTGGANTAGNGQSGAATAGAVGTAGAGAGANRFPCQNPNDLGNGLIQCTGFKHRPAALTCASHVPRSEPVANPEMTGACKVDADCTDKPYGWCGSGGGEIGGTYCNYGCIEDSDCGSNALCECAEPVGRCVHAQCASDADCQAGFLCKSYDATAGCEQTSYTCQTSPDTCGSDLDCTQSAGEHCVYRSDGATQKFLCVQESCAIGRPFLVEGAERLAPAAVRADWSELRPLPSLTDLDPLLRTRLAERWTRVALMEHASIAAFARFTLQLMSLGAPASLIERATAAMVDETQHAKACFTVASHYAAAALGPGRLAVERSLDESSLIEIVLNTIREGCVGETVAAIEAREAAEHASDPALRELLVR
ncbi:MAG TPA: ferritin-like domain-containing protein, partial [Polyangiaceae bacterium]